jgi:dipeptidyl aminopeptidase/acylaminoacyl peptidase
MSWALVALVATARTLAEAPPAPPAPPAPLILPAPAAPLILPAPLAPPAPGAPLAADRLARLTAVAADLRDVTIAPTGRLAAWTEVTSAVDGSPTGETVVRVAELPALKTSRTRGARRTPAHAGRPAPGLRTAGSTGAPASGFATSPAGAYGPAWAPDGGRLAFLAPSPGGTDSGGPGGQAQIWVSAADFSGARELTLLTGSIDSLLWSRDGRQIAFLYEGPTPEPTDRPPDVAPAGSDRAPARTAGGAGDADGRAGDGASPVGVGEVKPERRLAVIDAATGSLQLVSPPGLFVFEFDWAPDGGSFVAVATSGDGDAAWWNAELYLLPYRLPYRQADSHPPALSARSGEAVLLFKPPYQVANPRFSPDGRAVAFIGGLMSDQGAAGGDIYLLPVAGGEPADLTPELAGSPAWLAWTSPGEIVFVETVDGACAVASLDRTTRAVSVLWSAPQLVSTGGAAVGLALAHDGRTAAAVLQGFTSPPEVWAGPLATLGRSAPLTHRHADLRPAWGEARSLHWQADAGRVQGWLLAPPDALLAAAPGGLHPLVVMVHGGPAGAVKAAWPTISGALANHGFYVLMPNPRGSFGAGEAFTRANVRDFGYGDWRDIQAGIDAVVAQTPIDRARIGIFGWSYGGYLAMWAVTQTDRFRAAVAGAGIANWQSYYGETGFPFVTHYFGATPYLDPQVYARSSPLTFITRVKTPTLILHGDHDTDVPPAQALEFWQGLKTLGVETRLVLLPGEGHRLSPRGDRDRLRNILAWFDTHLK